MQNHPWKLWTSFFVNVSLPTQIPHFFTDGEEYTGTSEEHVGISAEEIRELSLNVAGQSLSSMVDSVSGIKGIGKQDIL